LTPRWRRASPRGGGRIVAVLSIALLAPVAPVYGWGCDAHRLVAAIAATRLTTAVRTSVATLTDGASLAAIACWADEIRAHRRETKRWHYVDIPRAAAHYVPTRDCRRTEEGDCLLAALARASTTLREPDATTAARFDALRFLVHLLPDLHQPLHCTDDDDAGGNGIAVRFFQRRSNLHAVWDRGLIEASQAAAPGLRLRVLAQVRELTPTSTWDFERWANETHEVGQHQVYPGLPADRRLADAYVAAHAPIVERQLARAAARLGDTLNLLLGPPLVDDSIGNRSRATNRRERRRAGGRTSGPRR
jgi:S1/P1 Nuclease